MSSSWLQSLPLGVAAFATPLILSWVYRSARNQRASVQGDSLVFPVARSARIAGMVCVALGIWGVYASATARSQDTAWWVPFGFALFVFFGIWLSVGEFRLYESRVEKKFLWLSKSLSWTEVDAFVPQSGGFVLYGGGKKIAVWPHYVDYDRLAREICNRAPTLRAYWRQRELPKNPYV